MIQIEQIFNLKHLGLVVVVSLSGNDSYSIGDLLVDSNGYRFKLKSIAHVRKHDLSNNFESIGLEALDNTTPSGILQKYGQ